MELNPKIAKFLGLELTSTVAKHLRDLSSNWDKAMSFLEEKKYSLNKK